jgi:hypothetical protein
MTSAAQDEPDLLPPLVVVASQLAAVMGFPAQIASGPGTGLVITDDGGVLYGRLPA